tara:strand:+ start:116 stop:427 length:312 start_codon:yes stop_codon:yes gene_type:complete
MKILKFNKVASSANDANVFYYVNADDIKHWVTAATTCTIYILGAGANAALDTIVITGVSGDGDVIADKIAELIHANRSAGGGAIYTIDKDFVAGITTLAYAAV